MSHSAIDNLKPVRSKSEAREKGKKGGIASGEARREKRALRERLETILMSVVPGVGDVGDQIAIALIEKAKAGNIQAFEVIRDTIGERPDSRVDMTSSDGSMVPLPPLHVHFVTPEDGKD